MLRPIQVRHHLSFMRNRGFSAREVLAGSKIEAAKLEDPAYLVSPDCCHRVVRNIVALTRDSGIGLKMGSAMGLGELGIVGYAMASSSNLGEAVALWLQYGNSPVGFPFTLKAVDDPGAGTWGIIALSNGMSGAIYRFYVEEILAMGVNFLKISTGLDVRLVEIQFAYPKPSHHRLYEQLFDCPISFDAARTQALVLSPSPETPVKSNDSELRELCIRHCSQVVRHISQHGPVSARLRALLTARGSMLALDQAAEAMNLGPRTLRRKLKAEGSSFQAILDELRADLAREYLAAGLLPTKEIAFRLGFSDVESFRRAFKAWTGMIVGTYIDSVRKAR